MFPTLDNGTLNEERLAWIRLQERVTSWLHGIHDPEPRPTSSFLPGLKDRKRHHYSPYPPRCEPPRAPPYVPPPVLSCKTQLDTTLVSEFPASASEASLVWRNINQFEYRTTSLIEFKVADDLPDPEYNPLITFFATDIEEEYCRLLFLCNKLETDKIEVDLRWKRDMSYVAMRELLDIEISIQRVLQSARYVMEYSYHCNLKVDFQTLFLQHYLYHPHTPFQQLPPQKHVHATQYRGENWAYSGETPQNRSHCIQNIREQRISEFDCQVFTGLNPDAHNLG